LPCAYAVAKQYQQSMFRLPSVTISFVVLYPDVASVGKFRLSHFA